MRSPRILVYERDGRLAWLLKHTKQTVGLIRGQGDAHGWSLREPRRLETCLKLLADGSPAILIVRMATRPPAARTPEEEEKEGRRQDRAVLLLDHVRRLRPETAVIAVSDQADDALAGLAWDLGAAYVLFPPQPMTVMPGIVAHLMNTLVPPPAPAAPEPLP